MDISRRRFLAYCGAAVAGGLHMNLLGCGGRGFLAGTLLEAPAQGGAKAPERPKKVMLRDDLHVPGTYEGTVVPNRLMAFAQLTDVHITLEQFTMSGHPKLEAMLDRFGGSIGFGGLDRPEIQERYDLDVLRAMIKTLNAYRDQLDFVVNTGDSVDIGTRAELVGFLAEMNQLTIPWFQTMGNHDCLGLGNIPSWMLESIADLDFVTREEFIRRHFPETGNTRRNEAFGSRAKGFDFSPGAKKGVAYAQGYYAFTALPAIAGTGDQFVQPGIRFYVLDTVGPQGSAAGHLGDDQLEWFSQELDAHPSHMAIVVAHHPVGAIRQGGEAFLELLLSRSQVIALVCGHAHVNRIRAYPAPDAPGRGFWQIQTSSLIDYPQQARIIELWNNGNGTGSIYTYVFNQQATGELGKHAWASWESAAHEGFQGTGDPIDRNVELRFKMPLKQN
ncbi:MAG: metallophosphoesterase [Deltaproteobacteria bacterium]|nr:metallophosphoesterase [Deltaproteobacteria bacterium]